MTLTIADRWSVTLRVQSLARVTMPPKAPVPASREPDAAAIAEMQQVQAELALDRARWEAEAFFCGTRRMF
jgi:hypothetical protein